MFKARHSTVNIALGGLLVLGMAGCSSSLVTVSPEQPRVAVVTSVRTPAVVADPLLAYAQDPKVLLAVQEATDILTKRCMASFGYPAYVVQDIDRPAASFAEGNTRLYGITDRAVAARYGYLPAPTAPFVDGPKSTTGRYRLVLTGLRPGDNPARVSRTASPGMVRGQVLPAGGCLGAARTQLTGNIQGRAIGAAALGFQLDVTAWADAWTDSRTENAKDDWSLCMADHGYRVHDPIDDQVQRGSVADVEASAAEIKQALADIGCKESTDFTARASAVNAVFAQRSLDANRAALEQSKEFNENALLKSREVIADNVDY